MLFALVAQFLHHILRRARDEVRIAELLDDACSLIASFLNAMVSRATHDRSWHRTATLHGPALPRGPQNALEGPQPYQVARIPTDTMVVFRSSLKAVCTSA